MRQTKMIAVWRNYWFQESSGLNLAVCRILIVGTFLLFMFPSLNVHIDLLEKYDHFQSPPVIIMIASSVVPESILRTPLVFSVIYSATLLFGIFTLIGLFTRTSSLFFGIGSLFLISHIWSYGEFHHPPTLYLIFFLILPFSAAGLRLSVDALLRLRKERGVDIARDNDERFLALWPLKLMRLIMAIVYFNACWSKFEHAGIDWVNGYTLQSYILQYGIQFDKPMPAWLGQQHLLCLLLSYCTILFEGFFFTALIWRKSLPYWLVGGVLFHLGLCFFVEGSFSFLPWIVIYATFINFEPILMNRKKRVSEILDNLLGKVRNLEHLKNDHIKNSVVS